MRKKPPEVLLIIDETQKMANWSETIKKLWTNKPEAPKKLRLGSHYVAPCHYPSLPDMYGVNIVLEDLKRREKMHESLTIRDSSLSVLLFTRICGDWPNQRRSRRILWLE